jgi:hypothetical protein
MIEGLISAMDQEEPSLYKGRETHGAFANIWMGFWLNLKKRNLFCLVAGGPIFRVDTSALRRYPCVWSDRRLGKISEWMPDINAGGVICFEAAPSSSQSDFSVLPTRPCQQQTKLNSQRGGKENLESNRSRLIY